MPPRPAARRAPQPLEGRAACRAGMGVRAGPPARQRWDAPRGGRMPLHRFFAAVAVLLSASIGVMPAAAQPAADLQLVLAVDASGSVDQYRFELQKRGYVAAFRHARVLEAIRSGPSQAIAVTMAQWTGPTMQVHV